MCFSAAWKRENVESYKFDHVNMRDFRKTDFFTRLKYVLVYIYLIQALVILGLDIFTMVVMLSTGHWSNQIQARCTDQCVIDMNFTAIKWLFAGCIIFSILLIIYEANKARIVIRSRDISYAYTNVMANQYLSLRDYNTFCFFCRIGDSSQTHDDFALFVFFTFKTWKTVLLADGPRQSINAIILFSIAKASNFQTSNLPAYWDNSIITLLLLLSMMATVALYIISLVLLVVAAICYVPLLCFWVQGNLKEYCVHLVDLRIARIIKKAGQQRAKKAAESEKPRIDRNGRPIGGPSAMRQPTLPKIALENEIEGGYPGDSLRETRGLPTSRSQRSFGSQGAAPLYTAYPPRPPPPAAFYSTDHGSTTRLTEAAAPPGVAYPEMQYGVANDIHAYHPGYSGAPSDSGPPASHYNHQYEATATEHGFSAYQSDYSEPYHSSQRSDAFGSQPQSHYPLGPGHQSAYTSWSGHSHPDETIYHAANHPVSEDPGRQVDDLYLLYCKR